MSREERRASLPPRAARTKHSRAVTRDDASRVLWLALLVLAIARVLASISRGAWAWGLASFRHVPRASWVLFALAAIALVPLFARPAVRLLDALGDAWTGRPSRAWLAIVLFAVIAGAAAWLLDDRGFFVGDFALRLGIIRQGVPYVRAFPQALPIDVLLHGRLIGALAHEAGADPLVLERELGVARAALTALLGIALAVESH